MFTVYTSAPGVNEIGGPIRKPGGSPRRIVEMVARGARSRNWTLPTGALRRVPSNGEESLRALLDAAPLPLTLTRAADSVVLYGNRRSAALFEVPPDEIPGQCAAEFWVDRRDRAGFLEALRSSGHVDGHEARMKTSRGRVFWARISAQTLHFAGELCMLGGIVDVSDAHALEERLRALAITDPLTGAYNRRHFADLAEAELRRAARYGHPTSLVMLDIDHFKAVNDDLGHAAGDAVLRGVARIVADTVRGSDVVARIGGEEFALLFPETTLRAARATAERIRRAVRSQSFASEGLPADRAITLSLGLTQQRSGETLGEVMQRADEALYTAKAAGRDRVVVFAHGERSLSTRRAAT
jgi:diguanylate cyclase (GGDEF)-like protein/PAS domain S-box-containing protein